MVLMRMPQQQPDPWQLCTVTACTCVDDDTRARRSNAEPPRIARMTTRLWLMRLRGRLPRLFSQLFHTNCVWTSTGPIQCLSAHLLYSAPQLHAPTPMQSLVACAAQRGAVHGHAMYVQRSPNMHAPCPSQPWLSCTQHTATTRGRCLHARNVHGVLYARTCWCATRRCMADARSVAALLTQCPHAMSCSSILKLVHKPAHSCFYTCMQARVHMQRRYGHI